MEDTFELVKRQNIAPLLNDPDINRAMAEIYHEYNRSKSISTAIVTAVALGVMIGKRNERKKHHR